MNRFSEGLIRTGATAAGWNDFEHMQTSSELAVLRDLPEFRELIESHAAPAVP